ncbi:MAG: hypothetical protein ACRDQA_07870 [Nocardioidaceae bacterium]
MSAHAAPLHCPYCAGEHLHPHADRHGAWECRECLRAFSVSFIGLLAPQADRDSSAAAAGAAAATQGGGR